MSAYRDYQTEFADQECLIESLEEVRPAWKGHIQTFGEAKQLVDYHGNLRPDTAEIVVPRKYVDMSANDIGFKKTEKGTYKAIISQYDSHRHGPAFLNEVKVAYTEKKSMRGAAAHGMKFQRREVVKDEKGNNKVRLIFAAAQNKL